MPFTGVLQNLLNPWYCFRMRFRSAAFACSTSLLFFLPVAALTISASPAAAQRGARVRPAFEPKLVRHQTVSGIVHFKIVARRDGLPHEFAPIGSGGWAAVVRVDGHILASRTKLPAVIEWDTRTAGDGAHDVHVAVRNEHADQEVGVEGAQLIVDNAAADTAADAAPPNQTSPPRDVPTDHWAYETVLPESAKVRPLAVRFSRSPDAFATRATALLRTNSRLYMGLEEGGLKFCSLDAAPKKSASVIRLPVAGDSVQSLVAGGGRVWWTTRSGRYIYAYTNATHTVTRYDVTATVVTVLYPFPPVPTPAEEVPVTETAPAADSPAAPPAFIPETPPPPSTPVTAPFPIGWVRQIVLVRGKVLIVGGGIVRLLNPRSGRLTDASTVPGLLPDEAFVSGNLSIAAGDGPRAPVTVVAVTFSPRPDTELPPGAVSEITTAAPRWRRYRLQSWRSGQDGVWRPASSFTTDADPERAARLAVSPDALATSEREGPRLVNLSIASADPQEFPFSLSPGMPSSTDRVTVGASGLWWEQRGMVFRADTRTGARDAFLPWNVSSELGAVLAMTADKEGVWVATTSGGVRRILPGRPTARDGYNGYVRARLGSGTLRPPTSRDSRIAWAIEAWQGVPYVWGGQSRSGADCSGFVMRMHQVGGVSIPRTSAGMRHASKGRQVRDELRWGDTLVYPGHCAIYVGDGRTAETVGGTRGGSVSHSNIWVRSSVVVRRFLP